MSKIAYLFGLNYTGTSCPLQGCHNDVDNMNNFLRQNNWYTVVNKDAQETVTRKMLLKSLLDLVLTGARELFFHYSGHGSHQADENGDETDGQDEGLVVYSELSKTNLELVLDDEIKGILMCLKPHQTLYLFFDCCHSGTMGDLAYNMYQKWNNSQWLLVKDRQQSETNGQVILISGCLDSQTSADAYIKGKYQGACTRSFLEAYQKNKSWSQLITDMQRYLTTNGYRQVPVISTGKFFNLTEPVSL